MVLLFIYVCFSYRDTSIYIYIEGIFLSLGHIDLGVPYLNFVKICFYW